MESLEEKVRNANKKYHDRIDIESYDENESIFSEHRQRSIRRNLKIMSESGSKHLDVGCGTGNVLRIAENYFSINVGVDVSNNMLQGARRTVSDRTCLTQAEGTKLPFEDNTFDAVTFYAILHHFPTPAKFLREGARVLKPGGYLYTDHDPNYYLVRFYFPLYKLMHMRRTGFGSEEGDLAEFFHTQRPGIDPEPLVETLRSIPFSEVNLDYYQTRNRNLSIDKKIVLAVLGPLSNVLPLKSFFTHFSILARK